MKVLVTGANGQVGSEVVNRAQNYGMEIVSLDRDQLDISDDKSVLKLIVTHNPLVIINAAAYTAVDKAEEEQQQAYAINQHGVENLVEACKSLDIPLFHISTDYVFDGEKIGAYLESDQPNPQSNYGKSKLQGDMAASKWHKHIILRVAWVFGVKGNNFVKTMLRLGRDKSELSIVNDQTGAPTFAGDIAEVLLNLCQQYKDSHQLKWGVYHYTGKDAVTWFQFAQEIFKQALRLGVLSSIPKLKPIETSKYPTPAQRPKNSVLNCSKINKAFNIEFKDWRIGLEQVILQEKNT